MAERASWRGELFCDPFSHNSIAKAYRSFRYACPAGSLCRAGISSFAALSFAPRWREPLSLRYRLKAGDHESVACPARPSSSNVRGFFMSQKCGHPPLTGFVSSTPREPASTRGAFRFLPGRPFRGVSILPAEFSSSLASSPRWGIDFSAGQINLDSMTQLRGVPAAGPATSDSRIAGQFALEALPVDAPAPPGG
jgi:hypothetical protein